MFPALPYDIEDRYTVTAELGRGSHAIVYRAHDRLLDREVAVKVLRQELVGSEVNERFLREIRLTSRLDHPNIAHVYGTGEFLGAPYFVIALARGPSLADRLAREHQLPVDEALSIARQVGAALAHAHKAGVIHRDVKPANILLTPEGALLTDFGVARALAHAPGTLATSTGTAVGTLLYMSPEQLCAEKDIDGRSDQYELALVLYEMLAGVPPHVAANAEGLRGLRIVGQHVPVRTHRPSVPVAVEEAIDRALCPTPADRFPTMLDFVAALDGSHGIANAYRSSSTRAVPAPSTGSLREARWRLPALVAAGLLAAGGLGAKYWLAATAAKAPAPAPSVVPLSSSTFALVPAGDTARSAPLARAIADELRAWAGTSADVASRGTGTATPVTAQLASVAGGVRATLMLGGAPSRSVAMTFANAAGFDADSLRLLAARVISAAIVAPDSADQISVVRERPAAAVRKYGEAWSSLLAGDLTEAETKFAEAGQTGAVPQAALWQANVGSWRKPKAPAAWRDAARDAAAHATSLARRDSLLAAALDLRSRDHLAESCATYSAATQVDGGSFAAWYGLGDCLATDSIVVADRRSPTGASFRSSHWSALRAFEEAARRLPSPGLVPLFDRLPRVALALLPSRRSGSMLNGGALHAGLPSVDADSVTVFPQSLRTAAAKGFVVPSTYQAAVRLGRRRLLQVTSLLVARAPSSLAAQLGQARALEFVGLLEGSGADPSALSALSSAKALVKSPQDSIDVALIEARVRLRISDFTGVARVAAGILHGAGNRSPADAARLTALATLVGATAIAETLMVRGSVRSSAQEDGLPDLPARAVARYVVAAADGRCAELDTLRAAAYAALAGVAAQAEMAAAESRWLGAADWMRLTCAGAPLKDVEDANDPLIVAFAALARRDTVTVAREIQRMQDARAGAAASAITWDTRYAETWLLVQVGALDAARHRIADTLGDLSATMDYVLFDVRQGAALRGYLAQCGALEWPADQLARRDTCRRAVQELSRVQ